MLNLLHPVVACVVAIGLFACGGGANGVASRREPKPPLTFYKTDDPALDKLQQFLLPALQANAKAFRGRTGLVRGFGAGTAYPQIWLRDSATLIGLARYHYPREHLASWLEEHLAHQRDDGQLLDWVAAGEPRHFTTNAPRAARVYERDGIVLSADRNTTEADQESSAVHAAFQVNRILGDPAWLRRSVAGQPLIDRLDAALQSLLEKRTSPRFGLLTSAFTADWGDVSPVYGDQRAIYLDARTPVVVGLYTNALFRRSAQELAELHRTLGNGGRRLHWEEVTKTFRERINRHLWQEQRGFYRLHLMEDSRGWKRGSEDDSDRFALGGHAVALSAGIPDARQAHRIVALAEARRRRLGIPTIAGVLLPPFPSGVFAHPILAEPFTYQNGGEWDWIGARFLLAEFEAGHAARARGQLRELARRAVQADGLYEWRTLGGQGRGSRHYAAGAGALGQAIFAGLFGLDLGAGTLNVCVNLGDLAGEVRVHEPATGATVWYRYIPDLARSRLSLRWSSSVKGRGELRVLLPPDTSCITVRLDGVRTPFQVVGAEGHDEWVAVTTDWGAHGLEIDARASHHSVN